MSLRLAKQIIYGFFYLLVWGGLIAGFYFLFLKPAPSCFDHIQNQREEGVDCGGQCGAVCIPKGIKPIELVGNVSTFSTGQRRVGLVAKISNPNSGYAAKSFRYAFSLYDESGKAAKSVEGGSFIYASEIKYIVIPNVSVEGAGFMSKVDFNVRDTAWDSSSNFQGPPSLAVQDVHTRSTENGLIVEGRIQNNDTVVFPVSTVVAVFGGSFGTIAGASRTEVENLMPNESKQFSILYPASRSIDASSAKIFVYSARP